MKIKVKRRKKLKIKFSLDGENKWFFENMIWNIKPEDQSYNHSATKRFIIFVDRIKHALSPSKLSEKELEKIKDLINN